MSPPPSDRPDSDALSPGEAFALLGNDTRVGILQALWDAFESGTGDNAVLFSDLYGMVDVGDTGNFSYHLEKLTGPFVRRTEQGYELKQTGINVVRAVVAGTVVESRTFGPTPVDVDCPLCGSQLAISYRDEVMDVTCTACGGRTQWREETGHVFGALVPPGAIQQRTVEEAFHAATVYTMHRIAAFSDGVCAHCSGDVDRSLDVCTDHVPDAPGRCPNCDRTNLATVWMHCSTCKLSLPPPATLVVLADPTVARFYHDNGVEYQFATWDTVTRSYDVTEVLVSEDPLRLRFEVPAGDDELRLTVDEELSLLETTHRVV